MASTGRSRTLSGGRMPRLSLGTKLPGVVATSGAVRIGLRSLTSTFVTRADVMRPRPK